MLVAPRPGRRRDAASTRPSVAWSALLPLLILIGGGRRAADARRRCCRADCQVGWHAVCTIAVASAPIVRRDPAVGPGAATTARSSVVSGAVGVDGFSLFLTVVICASVILAALLADGYLRREGLDGPELYVLMLLSASGGVIMASANDLIVMFLGLEILSIAVYVLAAMHLRRLRSRRRPSSTSCSAPSPRPSSSTASPWSTAPPARTNLVDIADFLADHRPRPTTALLLAGFGAAARRLRLQGRRRAVPLLGARRLPGLAHARSSPSWPRA